MLQVVLNASVTHLTATQYVPSELQGRLESSLHQEITHAEWFFSLKMLREPCLKLEIKKFRCYEALKTPDQLEVLQTLETQQTTEQL